MSGKVMIVEDEMAISQVLRVYLEKAGYETVLVADGARALPTFYEENPDLVLLDVMLPHRDGWAILEDIRAEGQCPVIMLTALGDVEYRVDGLSQGADDYIAKPFEAVEVVARVQAVLRRSAIEDKDLKTFGSLQVDFAARRISLGGREIELTPRDMSLLLFLAENPNRAFTRDELIEHVWGWDYDGSDRAVDLSVKRIRQALEDWPQEEGEIKTMRGLGYQLSCS
ncbi:response regulator transcription factor [Aciduricibacillus chroicocephali]|uniref:Response regulator transcription factor n=1 Tax=Aciduricibacillus chroicocephali TaxID=3054939 RepID=A0ABY9KUP6_9BACI|nr:response regulator transcription factor [Bacillaceae bacterium 44XB]